MTIEDISVDKVNYLQISKAEPTLTKKCTNKHIYVQIHYHNSVIMMVGGLIKARKTFCVMVCVVMIATMFVVAVPVNVSAQPLEVWVDDDFGPSTPGWQVTHFDKIQDGVDAVAEGGTVNVYAGMYYENVIISKSITLQGEDKDTTIIDGGGAAGDGVHITANRVNVSGFTVTGSSSGATDAGIELNNVQNCNITNNKISPNNGDGIRLSHSSWNNITDNNASSNNYYGIVLIHSNRNDITDNNASYNLRGIYLLNDCIGNTITNNNASNNKEMGVDIDGSSNTIANNIVLNNLHSGMGYGIHLWVSSNSNTIANNTFSNNNYGIVLDRSCNNTIENNKCSHNDYGIHLFISDSNVFVCNTFDSNNYGIYIRSSLNALIYHNNIIDNTCQAFDTNPAGNDWHHPGLLEGNYWSDYEGEDCGGMSYPWDPTGKHLIAGDGIGDTLVPHPEEYYDYYPFISQSGWREWERHYVDPNIPYPTHVVTALINNDLSHDVVVTYLGVQTQPGGVVWYANSDSHEFNNPRFIDDTIIDPWGVAVGDLNQDGTNDVTVVGDQGGVYWYANDGFGDFSSRIIIDTTLRGPREVFIADINGDTLPDVVGTGCTGYEGYVKWYENLGGGVFGSGILIDNLPVAWGLYVADIDGDIDLDVIATSANAPDYTDEGMVVWYANDGFGHFSPRIVIDDSLNNCKNIFATDIDMDGHIDVVASCGHYDKILGWYRNLGAGLFSPLIIIDSDLRFMGLDIADINEDGRLDIVIATESHGNWVLWYEKPLDPLISPWTKHVIDDDPDSPATNSMDVSAADIDNDSDFDVVAVLLTRCAVTWYENPLI